MNLKDATTQQIFTELEERMDDHRRSIRGTKKTLLEIDRARLMSHSTTLDVLKTAERALTIHLRDEHTFITYFNSEKTLHEQAGNVVSDIIENEYSIDLFHGKKGHARLSIRKFELMEYHLRLDFQDENRKSQYHKGTKEQLVDIVEVLFADGWYCLA